MAILSPSFLEWRKSSGSQTHQHGVNKEVGKLLLTETRLLPRKRDRNSLICTNVLYGKISVELQWCQSNMRTSLLSRLFWLSVVNRVYLYIGYVCRLSWCDVCSFSINYKIKNRIHLPEPKPEEKNIYITVLCLAHKGPLVIYVVPFLSAGSCLVSVSAAGDCMICV